MVRMTKLKQGLDTVKYLSLIEDIDTAYTLRSLLNTVYDEI